MWRAFLTVITFALLLVSSTATALAQQGAEDRGGCPHHPCPGWRYELLYRTSDGAIIATSAYPWTPLTGTLVVGPGQALLDIRDHPEVANLISAKLSEYYVDMATLQVKRRTGAGQNASVGMSLADADSSILWYALAAPLAVLAVGAGAMTRLRRR